MEPFPELDVPSLAEMAAMEHDMFASIDDFMALHGQPNETNAHVEAQAHVEVHAELQLPTITLPPDQVIFVGMEGVGKDIKAEIAAPFVASYNAATFITTAPKTNDVSFGKEIMATVKLSNLLHSHYIDPIKVTQICACFSNRACLACVEKGPSKRGDVVKGEMYCHQCLTSTRIYRPPTLETQMVKWLTQEFESWCYNIKPAAG
jgi:hypothetical protein